MKKTIMTVALLLASAQARANFYEITTPEEMVNCMQSYIQNWIVAPERISSWEHPPAYEFAGKYLFASWSTSPMFNYGNLSLMVGPNAPVYCDYPTDANGIPDRTKGFCRANVAAADVMFEYTIYKKGQEVKSQKKVAVVVNSKLLCLNITRPQF